MKEKNNLNTMGGLKMTKINEIKNITPKAGLTKVNSLDELAKFMKLDRTVVEKIIEEDPDAEVLEEYDGKFKGLLMEYINKFIVPQFEMTYKHENLENINNDLWGEVINIKLFCEWLDEEGKVKLMQENNK